MAKMTVGRQGNHFPLLTREFFHCMPRQTGYRENVIDLMAKIESIDPGAFCRVHKNNQNRIVPYVSFGSNLRGFWNVLGTLRPL